MNCFPKKHVKLVVFQIKTGPSGYLIVLGTLDVRNQEIQTIQLHRRKPEGKILIARSASYVRTLVQNSSVRSCVRPEDNYFLSRVYEPTTRASVYWQFGNLILKVPEKKLQKVKLSFNTGMFGTNFGTRFWRTFGATLTWDCDVRFMLLPQTLRASCPAGKCLV